MYCIVVLEQDQGKGQNLVNMEGDPMAWEPAFRIPRLKGLMVYGTYVLGSMD